MIFVIFASTVWIFKQCNWTDGKWQQTTAFLKDQRQVQVSKKVNSDSDQAHFEWKSCSLQFKKT